MSQVRTLARSFAGGEVTPEFWGRIDDGKYQTGLALCRNFIPLPHGPVANRAGTAFVRETKSSLLRSVVRSFSYSSTQTMVLELGDHYVRFHTQGAVLTRGVVAAYNGATAYTPGDLASSGGVDYVNITASTGVAPPAAQWYAQPASGEYEIPSQYAAADVPDIHIEQSLDVLTLVHTGYPVVELRRGGAVKWFFTSLSFVSALAPPTSVTSAATSPSAGSAKNHVYVVTALGAGADESLPSASTTVSVNLNGIGNFATISWAASVSPGVTRYNVYALEGGIYGFVGQASGLSFIDDNIAADTSNCPPENVTIFNSATNYPGAVGYHEQRRCFAGTLTQPQNFWGTRSGTESNMQYAIPTRDDDSLQFKIAARKNQTIRHLVSMQDLIMLTASAEWRVRASDGGALAPSTFSAKAQSYVGASNVQPLLFNNTLLFGANRGGHVREMGFSTEAGGYLTGDLSLRAPHRFDNLLITDAAASLSPYPIAWFVSSAGNLLSLTYVPEQGIGAWASHDTDGTYESICVVAEGNEDVLYAVVKRTIGGAVKRYVERLSSRQFATQADAFFVDCGLSYSGAPVAALSGLGHLEGKTVSILADGAVHPPQVVTGGAVALQAAASKAQVGLPITADLQLLPLAVMVQGFGFGRAKNVNSVWLRVYNSLGIKAGPSLAQLKEFPARTTEVFGAPPGLQSKECQIVLTPQWGDSGQVYVRQTDPLPLTIVSLELECELAG